MTTANEAYEVARQFTNDSVRCDVRYTIPADKLDQIAPFLSPLGSIGFQPKAIAADPMRPDRFAVASYFSPAIKFVQLALVENGYELIPDGGIGRSVQPSGERLRLFPAPLDDGSDGKRIASLAFRQNKAHTGELLIGREGEIDGLFRLVQTDEKEWHTLPRKLMLQGTHAADHYIEGITIAEERLYVLRSRQDGSPAWLEVYNLKGERENDVHEVVKPPASHSIQGIAKRYRDGSLYYATGIWSGLSVPPGIYRGQELVVPDLCVDGLAFAPDGSLLAVQYNDGLGELGSPGMIWRIPAAMIEGK